MKSSLSQKIRISEPGRLDLYRHSPQLGPKILFFSGGSSLRETSEELIQYTHNSIHIVTTMDSGGSSAILREAFDMPAVGDLRQRLLALADRSWSGNPAVLRLFSHRLDKTAAPALLRREIEAMGRGDHPLVSVVCEPMRTIIGTFLDKFLQQMPRGFDLRGASIGNLILASGYLEQRRQLDPIICLFSNLVHVRGKVRPVTDYHLYLAAELENGDILIGQHRLTGKEVPPIRHPIRRIFLTPSLEDPIELEIPVAEKIVELIAEADLICYPMGSFYSSLLVNLLSSGMGAAIRANPCPKVFIPNTCKDPELFGKTLPDQVEELLICLKKDDPKGIADHEVLNLVLLDNEFAGYPGRLNREELKKRGIEVAACRLINPTRHPMIDEKLLAPILLSLS
ncbi:MAG: GAK system CofD-like protein [Desulfuromonadaceae bacterium]|nr:GAK system CofD-like protein [Desulfuromonadaceae bacterium]